MKAVAFVKDPDAPFPYHMYVFNADGTMQQANPDAGDPRNSDSDGKGVWVVYGDWIKGKWVEVIADRATHKFTGRAEISFDVSASHSLERISHSLQAGESHEIVRTRQPISPADIRNLAGIRTPQNAPILAAK